jgi:hypothetical protein
MTRRSLALAVLTLATSMACMFVENMLFPPAPTPLPSPTVVMPTSIPTQTPTEMATAIPAVTIEPIQVPEPIQCTNDNCLDSCLERIDNVLQSQSYQQLPDVYAENQANINLVQFDVQGDKLLERHELWVPQEFRTYQEQQPAEASIWHFYIGVIPANLRSEVNKLMVFTDGESNVLAWVDQDPYQPEHWTVGFDLIDAQNPLNLTESLIHETGHLITLNTDQVTFGYYSGLQNEPQCPQFVLEEGCSKPKSYLNLFYKKFWVKMFDEWVKQVQQSDSTDAPEEIVYRFYLKYRNNFITDYAATNIKEDMAESFEYFVLHAKPRGKNTAEQKVVFFYQFPELVEARQQMIQGLCAYVPE